MPDVRPTTGLLTSIASVPGGATYSASSNPFANTNLNAPLSQSNALPGQNYFSSAVDNTLIPSQLSRGASFYSGSLNYGGGNSGIAEPNTVNSSDPMAAALANRYQGTVDNAKNAITTSNNVNAPVMASNNLSTVGNELNAEYQNQVQNFAQQYQFETQRQNLYNQYQTAQTQAQQGLLGSIFSGIGAVVGAVGGGLVAGPVGAVAGAAGLSKVGSAA